MKILAIETTAVAAGCAVVEDDTLLCESFVNVKLTHSQTLLPMVESMLKCSCVSLEDIDCFAVTAGPGSFTGVRIGVAAVKGMASVGNKPCVAVSSLYSLAYNMLACEDAVICPVMDARCSQVYNALFVVNNGKIERLCDDRAIKIEELAEELKKITDKRIFLVGDGALMCYNIMKGDLPNVKLAPAGIRFQSAASAGFAANELYENGRTVTAGELAPVYLRAPQAERNLKLKKECEKQC